MNQESQQFNSHIYTWPDALMYDQYDLFLKRLPQNIYPFHKLHAYNLIPDNFVFNESLIIYLKYLIIKDKTFEAMCVYKSIWLRRWIQKVPFEIQMRIVLINKSLINDGIVDRKNTSVNWVNQFFDKGIDNTHLAIAIDIFRQKNLFIINTKCSACNNTFPVSIDQNFVEHNDYFLCPFCMAKIIYSREELRVVARKYFNSELFKLPIKQPNEYSLETIDELINIARKLNKVSSIRFGVFRVYGAHLFWNMIFFYFFKRVGHYDSKTIDYLWTETDSIPWNTFGFELNLRFHKYMHPIARAIENRIPKSDPLSLSRKILDPPYHGIFFHTKKSKEIYRRIVKEFFSFTNDELKKGENELKKMGVVPGKKYACVAYRTDKYHKEISIKQYPDVPYKRTIQATAHRNANMESIKLTIKKLADYGYFVLLMGKEAPPNELIFEYDKYIIYSRDFRTEFLDMYLFLYSNIIVGLGGSQAFTFGHMRNNCLVLDSPDIWNPESVYSMTLTLPKHVYSEEKKRLLSPKELIRSNPIRNSEAATFFKEKFIHNSLNDIEQAIDEFIEIVEDRKEYSLELNIMHEVFYSYYQRTPLAHQIDYGGGRIASCFLNHYKDELLSSQ